MFRYYEYDDDSHTLIKGQAGLAGDWTETWDWWVLLACNPVSPPPRWPPRARRLLWCIYRMLRHRRRESCPRRARCRPYTHRDNVRDVHTPTTAPSLTHPLGLYLCCITVGLFNVLVDHWNICSLVIVLCPTRPTKKINNEVSTSNKVFYITSFYSVFLDILYQRISVCLRLWCNVMSCSQWQKLVKCRLPVQRHSHTVSHQTQWLMELLPKIPVPTLTHSTPTTVPLISIRVCAFLLFFLLLFLDYPPLNYIARWKATESNKVLQNLTFLQRTVKWQTYQQHYKLQHVQSAISIRTHISSTWGFSSSHAKWLKCVFGWDLVKKNKRL